MQSDVTLRSRALKRNLEITDSLRELISSIKSDSKFKAKLQANVPQIVVIGMQSAGKSTTLELLSGVHFPQSATMCTRVPIELKLRRGPLLPSQVMLKGPSGYSEQISCKESITENIKYAQDMAVEKSGQNIARDYCVEITCQDEEQINVTLVDLPGFFAPKKEENRNVAEAVRDLGEEYAKMKNSLVLHVMGIDQDYGNVLTKLTVSSLEQSKVINVFTKPDLLANQGARDAEDRLKDFLSETSAPRFVVCGKYPGKPDEEVQFIQTLGLFHDETAMKLGSRELREYLEDRISDHMALLLPEIRAEITEDLRVVNKALATVYKEPQVDEILQCLGMDIRAKWPRDVHDRKIRQLCEQLRTQIRQCNIESVKQREDGRKFRHVTTNELEVGDKVFILNEKDEFDESVVSLLNGASVILKDGSMVDIHQVHIVDLVSSLLEEVVEIMDQRGLTNVQFFNPQIVLDTYISLFADKYGKVIIEGADTAHQLTAQTIRDMFVSLEVPAAGQRVRDILQKEVLEACERLVLNLQVSADRAIRYCKPPLVFTTSDHHLVRNIHESGYISESSLSLGDATCVRSESRGKPFDSTSHAKLGSVLDSLNISLAHPHTDRRAMVKTAETVIRDVEAFWKVKVNMITEYFASELSLVFCVEILECIAAIATRVQKYASQVEDTAALKAERARYMDRKRVLQQALALF